MSSTDTAPRPKRPRKRAATTPKKGRSPFALVAQAGVVVGLIAGVVGLVFVFRPGWKPKAPVDVGTATISDVRLLKPVTFKRYLQEQELPAGSLTRQQLLRPGVLVSFHYELDGFRGRQLPLRWELNETKTNTLVDQDQAVTITPSTNAEGRDWYVWVPQPRARRRYYVRVTLYQPEKQLVPLEHFDTPPFMGG
jgi:hypothetical protein